MPAVNPLYMPDVTQHPRYKDALRIIMRSYGRASPELLNQKVRRLLAEMTGFGKSGVEGLPTWPHPSEKGDWREYITDEYVECMICGYRGSLLTEPHLRNHGGSKALYRRHFHIPPETVLAARNILVKRRNDMLRTKIWRFRPDWQDKTEKKSPPPTDDLGSLLGIDL